MLQQRIYSPHPKNSLRFRDRVVCNFVQTICMLTSMVNRNTTLTSDFFTVLIMKRSS